MKDNERQWFPVITIGIIAIIVSVVSALLPGLKVGPLDAFLQNTEESRQILQRIQEQLYAKNIEANPQLVSELKDKIQRLEKELEERARTTKDKRTEEALAAFKSGNYEKAKKLYEALIKGEMIKEAEHAKAAYNLGNVCFVELNFQKALDAYLDAVRLSPDNSIYLNEVGKAYYSLAQYDKAIEFYELVLESNLTTFGEDHPNVVHSWYNLGITWYAKAKYDKAIEYFEKMLKSEIKTAGEDHPNVAISRNCLGITWYAKAEYDKAIGYYEMALKSDINSLGNDHPNVTWGRNNLGEAWKAKGEYDRAIGYYEKALKSSLSTFGNDHPDVAELRNNLGMAWHEKGEYDKAIGYYEMALKYFKKAGLDHRAKTIEDNIKSISGS